MKCERCKHPLSEHCEGEKDHPHWKGYELGNKPFTIIHCTKKHCLQPLCSCIEFIPSKFDDCRDDQGVKQEIEGRLNA